MGTHGLGLHILPHEMKFIELRLQKNSEFQGVRIDHSISHVIQFRCQTCKKKIRRNVKHLNMTTREDVELIFFSFLSPPSFVFRLRFFLFSYKCNRIPKIRVQNVIRKTKNTEAWVSHLLDNISFSYFKCWCIIQHPFRVDRCQSLLLLSEWSSKLYISTNNIIFVCVCRAWAWVRFH